MGGIIIAGLVGSLITLIIKALIDALTETKRYRRKLRKQVFQRKTNAVEIAMSWYQEALDNYSMLQQACKSFGQGIDNFALYRLHSSTLKADKLFQESSSRLNPIYLYYDFSDIESKHNSYSSMQYINYGITEISKLDNMAHNITPKEFDKLYKSAITIFKEMSKAIEAQKLTIVEIQNKLREDYKQFIA